MANGDSYSELSIFWGPFQDNSFLYFSDDADLKLAERLESLTVQSEYDMKGPSSRLSLSHFNPGFGPASHHAASHRLVVADQPVTSQYSHRSNPLYQNTSEVDCVIPTEVYHGRTREIYQVWSLSSVKVSC